MLPGNSHHAVNVSASTTVLLSWPCKKYSLRADAWERDVAIHHAATGGESNTNCNTNGCLIVFAVSAISDAYSAYVDKHIPPAERLRTARTLCPSAAPDVAIFPPGQDGSSAMPVVHCTESEMNIALHQLDQIPSGVPEYKEASQLRSLVQTCGYRKLHPC